MGYYDSFINQGCKRDIKVLYVYSFLELLFVLKSKKNTENMVASCFLIFENTKNK